MRMRVRKISEQQDSFGLTHTTVVLSFPASITYSAVAPADVPEPVNFKSWSPERPWLYPFTLNADEDTVDGYFAMRCFSVEKDSKGILRFCLNHKPYFLHGILDRGYWSDGLMTAPCDEAFVYDISLAKGLGFNMLRKHIKIESLRWYYHCDRLGMIVWQDMVSGGSTYHMPWVCYMPTLFPTCPPTRRTIITNCSPVVRKKAEKLGAGMSRHHRSPVQRPFHRRMGALQRRLGTVRCRPHCQNGGKRPHPSGRPCQRLVRPERRGFPQYS